MSEYVYATRTAHEVMCVQNIGMDSNNGPIIERGQKVRVVHRVIGNNPGYTALTDDQIEELSKANEGASVDTWMDADSVQYVIKFCGNFSLDTRCYSVMRPCKCVIGHDDNYTYITTAKYTSFNSLSRLLTRVSEDYVKDIIISAIDNSNGKAVEIKHFSNTSDVIPYLQSSRRKEDFRLAVSKTETSTVDDSREENIEMSALQKELAEKDAEIRELRERVEELTECINKIKECIIDLP